MTGYSCPMQQYCDIIRSGKVDVHDDAFFSGLEQACRDHAAKALKFFTQNRKDCALNPSNWEGYGYERSTYVWISRATEPLGDV
jgi:hypothetical protein